MRRIVIGLTTVFAFAPLLRAADDKEAAGTPEAQYKALVKEYNKALSDFFKEYNKAKPEERQKLLAKYPDPGKFGQRFIDLAKKNAKDPAAVDALVWAYTRNSSGFRANAKVADKALAALARDHVKSPKLASVVPNLASATDEASESFLRKVIKENPSKEVQGRALMALAQSLQSLNRLAQLIRDNEPYRAYYEKAKGKKFVEALLAKKPEVRNKESEKLLNTVVKKYGDIKMAYGRTMTTLGKRADVLLFVLRNLQVGKAPPDVTSQDLEGKKVTLHALRGKVVVLDIWATWCPPCRAMIPHERELVKRLKDKPFVLVSISGDAKKETLVNFLKKESMPWKHWWNGLGGMLEKWNVEYFPTIYVIDAKGVIRYKDVRGKDMDKAVDTLLKEMEGSSKKKD
jgi:thiol-disulfide isomerase/thioredoxin